MASQTRNVFGTFKKRAPGLKFDQKAFLLGLFSGELIFSEGLVIGRNFAFQNWFGLSLKRAKHTKITA